MIKTDYMQKETFNRNFWDGFKALLGKGHVIKVGGNTTGTSAQIWALLMVSLNKHAPTGSRISGHRGV